MERGGRERGEGGGKEFMSIVVCSAEKLVTAANRGTWTVKRREKPRSGNLSTATERFCPPVRPKIGQFPSHRGFAGEFSSTFPARRSIDPEYLLRRLIITIRRRSRDRSIARSCHKQRQI